MTGSGLVAQVFDEVQHNPKQGDAARTRTLSVTAACA